MTTAWDITAGGLGALYAFPNKAAVTFWAILKVKTTNVGGLTYNQAENFQEVLELIW